MDCPQCGGPLWDNTQKNRQRENEGKKPLPQLVCKDKDGCAWVKWPPKNQSQQGAKSSVAPRPTGPLAPLYGEAMEIAARAVTHYCKAVGVTASASDIVAGAATIFIAATNGGRPIKAPAAPKPRPVPPPEPEPEVEDFNDDTYDDPRALPF